VLRWREAAKKIALHANATDALQHYEQTNHSMSAIDTLVSNALGALEEWLDLQIDMAEGNQGVS
jgi:hypothetical protein